MLGNVLADLRDLPPACREYSLKADSELAAVSMSAAVLLIPPMAFLDYFYYHLTADFFVSVAFEALFAVFTAVIVILVRRSGDVRTYEKLAFAWVLVTGLFAFLITVMQPQRVVENIQFSLLFLVANFVTIQNKFLFRMTCAAIIYSAFLTALVTNHAWSAFAEKYMLTLLLLMLTMVGIVVVARNNRFKLATFTLHEGEREARLRYESLAMTDALTGVPNRRSFLQQAGQEWSRFKRHSSVFSIAITDLDRFKQFNDTHGHAVGDEVLKRFAALIAAQARALDSIARFGGEEFAFIFRETGQNGAEIALARLRDRLRSMKMDVPDLKIPVTFSAGIAEARPEDASLEDTIGRADKALYRAKELGRDRTELG
jgi:diguanylate cyclase (GGDEF)-like protein